MTDRKNEDLQYISTAAEIIETARNGGMFILIDDEDRENEGDLVIPAQMATPESINFMAKYGRGLICLAFNQEDADRLDLHLMPRSNVGRFDTNFTVSIEARSGITTGISASDRAHTIATAIRADSTGNDISTPGHVFPLVARAGGVLVRAGHTEAAVDIAQLAGLTPAGVICEIMNDDGDMMRLGELIPFAKTHGLKIGSIADLIAHRAKSEKLIEAIESGEIETPYGKFNMTIYANKVTYAEHIALSLGDVANSQPALVRMHALNIMRDVLSADGKGWELKESMRQISEKGSGAIIILRPPTATALSQSLKQKNGKAEKGSADLRDYGVGAQILLDMGITDMVLLTNTKRHVVGLEGYGLKITDYQPLTKP